ncbi:methylenetetrahydrofolate--tRNA-(uracil(54)-C(5))-methyltransferase (FADH(2)-oxidizing) TrmFO [Harryflintia acetispora]|uniref:Methylenetetrahydrofolate--tRNA-(uracil-5-)-methyltransferase TrmFO n=1 Tax=Harryflintia acetispora TaxID=1849041 RepID=A0A9X8ULQ5_9FIRM|nr:methylenetetrahydrofolate--tRNA-(uracil(54)-C(5))-methyltransferase (FADH(2)-oxidizing) TrmFO [Harryflintia acetispora]TCL44686.1 methylenetetrahydrofolate--tRNA-(uracil-5-)-methyltransferase [Harryflintia acetispora]
MTTEVHVVGAGLAGSEAAWRLAQDGVRLRLHEMKPQKFSPAHSYPGFAELVCSNSLKASRLGSAAGLLKEEMRVLGSLTMEAAQSCAVSAGGALAVDRTQFSDYITAKLRAHPNIEICEGEVREIPQGFAVIASGPLTSDALAAQIGKLCGKEYLSFYDAAAPIVAFDSIDLDKVFFAARYDRGEADYINCPMDKEQYLRFHHELVNAESAPLHDFDDAGRRVYEGCMPIEVLAKRGEDAIRFGPLKPVGLRDPRTGHRPWAVVQLRKENACGTMYNLVGFQTNLKFPEQKRVFSLIPGLQNASFLRYGVMHRNTFLDSPKLLDSTFCLKSDNRIYFAGQMTGVEGYIESAMSGLLCGINLSRRLRGQQPVILPPDTMMGALSRYVAAPNDDFQPMGCNMGLLPPWPERIRDKQARYTAVAERAMESLRRFMAENQI